MNENTKSIELEYDIECNEDADLEREVGKETAAFLEELAKPDSSLRQHVEQEKILTSEDLKAFDEQVAALKHGDPSATAASLISVENRGQGASLEMLWLAVVIVPPIIEHYVAPVAVHVTNSIWDKLILPRLERKYAKVEPRPRGDKSSSS